MSLELVLITGMSGSGKSVALHALEDAGFNCVDNLPPELLLPFIQLAVQQCQGRHAVAIDVRRAQSLPQLPPILKHASTLDVHVRLLFLDASTSVLVQRFSETRRRHPLSAHDQDTPGDTPDLIQAIEREREGMTQREAILEACHERARPIVMTSLAMMAGMLPTMVILMTRDMRAMEASSPWFWASMSAATLVASRPLVPWKAASVLDRAPVVRVGCQVAT